MSDTDDLIATPRTDAIVKARLDYTNDEAVLDDYRAMVKHARTLERELTRLQAEVARVNGINGLLNRENQKQLQLRKDGESRIEKLTAALGDLVRLKTLKNRMDTEGASSLSLSEINYFTQNWPLAWAAARAIQEKP